MFEKAAKVLMQPGSVGVIPTDTIYGLVARATDKQAVDKFYALKPREFKPDTLIAYSIEQLVRLGFKRRYVKAVEQFWPGPVSVIVPAPPELAYLHLGRGSLPVRLPAGNELGKLLQAVGPLMTTSANRPGEPMANTIEEAREIYGDKVAIYVDGGDLSGRLPSTIIRVIDDAIEVLRQAASPI